MLKFFHLSDEILTLISSVSCFKICQWGKKKSRIWESQSVEICNLLASCSYLSLHLFCSHCSELKESLPTISQASVFYPLYQQEKVNPASILFSDGWSCLYYHILPAVLPEDDDSTLWSMRLLALHHSITLLLSSSRTPSSWNILPVGRMTCSTNFMP